MSDWGAVSADRRGSAWGGNAVAGAGASPTTTWSRPARCRARWVP